MSQMDPSDEEYLKTICKSLVAPREEPQLTNFKHGSLINVPAPTGENIAVFIQKAENPLPSNPILLFTHGDGETIDNFFDFYTEVCPHGVSFCIMDYRGNGYSEGTAQTSSVRETEDVFTVINYLKSEGYGKISYFGRSLGATCGIFVASKMPDLVCLALDSPMIDYKDCTIYQAKRFSGIPTEKTTELYPEACKIIKEQTGIDFLNIEQPIEAAAKIKQPLFLIHGQQDQILPFWYSEKLIETVQSEEKIFIPFPKGHNSMAYRDLLFEEMMDFILKHNGVEIEENH